MHESLCTLRSSYVGTISPMSGPNFILHFKKHLVDSIRNLIFAGQGFTIRPSPLQSEEWILNSWPAKMQKSFFYDLILSCSAAFSVKPHNILIAHRPFHRQLEEGAGQ